MTDFFLYLSCSTLALAALYLLYKVSMSYETLHRFNRVLLLGFVVLSAVLPLCRIEVVEELPAVEPVEFVAPMTDSVVYEVAESFNYTALLQMAFFALFLLGVVVMIARLVISIMSVKRIIRSGEQQSLEGGVTLTIVDKPISPFSWFGYIVVSRADVEQNRDIILTHEMAHIRLYHSWDVMAVDLALCFWWFNPAMWLLRRELQSLHEYQADDEVLNSGIDAQTYQLLLIKRAVGSRLHSVANCLNHSNLNKRITMMCKKTSSRWSAAKALLVLPLVAVSLAATATTVYLPREVQDKVTENSVNEQPEKSSVVKISRGKIYLNGEKITIEELKAKVAEWDSVTIEADKDVKMGDVAELKEALRENGSLKVNYLVAEDEPKQNKKASAEEAPVAEEKERVATVSEQPKDVATIVVKENKKYLYNGKEIKDESELMRLLEEYECETINVVLETTNTTPLLLHILPKVAKNVNYKYMLVKENPISNDENVVKELTAHIKGFLQQIPNKPASVFVTSVDIKVGRLGAVTVEKITTSRDISSDRNAQVVYSRVKGLFEHYYNGKLIPKEPVKLHFDVVFAKSVNGELIYDDVPLGDNAVWVIGYDENVAEANAKAAEAKVAESDDMPYIKVEKMPTFMGGDLNAFRNWVQSKIQYPREAKEEGLEGRVIFSFVVEKDGSMSEFTVLQSPDKILADEVEHVFNGAPKWVPGEQRGEKVRVKYTVPIVFEIRNY